MKTKLLKDRDNAAMRLRSVPYTTGMYCCGWTASPVRTRGTAVRIPSLRSVCLQETFSCS